MAEIRGAIKGLRRRLVATKFVDCFLNSLLISIFLIGVLLLFNLKFIYALVVGLLFLIVGFYRSLKKSSLKEIERKIPGLRWRLRTAADNISKNNEVVESLHKDVCARIGYVSLFDLFSGKKTILRVVFFVVLFLGVFYINDAGINFVDIAEGVGSGSASGFSKISGMFSFDDSGEEGEKDIYGDEKDIGFGKKKIDIGLNAEENIVNLDELKNAEGKDFKGKDFTGKIDSGQDSSYDEDIDSKDKEIVEKFYNKLYKQ